MFSTQLENLRISGADWSPPQSNPCPEALIGSYSLSKSITGGDKGANWSLLGAYLRELDWISLLAN